MSTTAIQNAWAETRKLESLGIVLPDPELAERMSLLVPERKAGRPRLYKTEAEKKKAYRARVASKVTDMKIDRKPVAVSD